MSEIAVTITKATVRANIYKNFYDLISDIANFTDIVFPEFPSTRLDAKGDYPVIVIDPPDVNWAPFTLGRNELGGTIDVIVYENNPKDGDAKADLIDNEIETSKTTLITQGLRNVKLESTTATPILHGSIKVHMRTLTFSYNYYFDNTA